MHKSLKPNFVVALRSKLCLAFDAKATLSVGEKDVHLPWGANKWPLIWGRTFISSEPSCNLTHPSSTCQLSPVCIGEGNSTAGFSPGPNFTQQNLGKLQLIKLEVNIFYCVFCYYQKLFCSVSRWSFSQPSSLPYHAKLFHLYWDRGLCARIKVTISSLIISPK